MDWEINENGHYGEEFKNELANLNENGILGEIFRLISNECGLNIKTHISDG